MKPTSSEKFYMKTQLNTETSCLEWTGYVMPQGYGQVRLSDGRLRVAHVAALLLNGYEVPEGMDVDHVCHNLDKECAGGFSCAHRRCVRLSHLEIKTRAQNLADSPVMQRHIHHKKKKFLEDHAGHDISYGKWQPRCRTCRRVKYQQTGR